MAILFGLSPVVLFRADPGRRGIVPLATMGLALALALATTGTSASVLTSVHEAAWCAASILMLDLALPRRIRPALRYAPLAGVGALAMVLILTSAPRLDWFARWGLETVPLALPPALLVASGILHNVSLARRGRPIEGLVIDLGFVGLAVMVGFAWFGPGSIESTFALEAGAAVLLWLGHLGWLDVRWRALHRVGFPFVASCCIAFVGAVAFAPSVPTGGWLFGAAAVSFCVLWWLTYRALDAIAVRWVWGGSKGLADSLREAEQAIPVGGTIEEIGAGVLCAIRRHFGHEAEALQLFTLKPPLRVDLDAAGNPRLKSAEPPPSIELAVTVHRRQTILDLVELRGRMVREPDVRDLAAAMGQAGIGCALPCMHLDEVEALLLLPLAGRDHPLSRLELDELGRLGAALGSASSTALAGRRAQSHINELSSLRKEAEDRIAVLEGELAQLRSQCDFLGRALAEDRSLHVAYSASMRQVQTRAITLAPVDDPVLLVAPPGAPSLSVSRFIHDRGPRWEAPFVAADCSSVPRHQLLEHLMGSRSEHRTGWLESASHGTLFIRDLPAFPREAQVALASALASGVAQPVDAEAPYPVHARIIATSRLALEQLSERDALDFRLAELFASSTLDIPPLRHRRDDLTSLVLLAIDRACRVLGREPVGVERDAMQALLRHDWPGDVAELEFIIESAVARVEGSKIGFADLPPLAWPKGTDDGDFLSGTYAEVEHRLLDRALRRAGGNKSEAARMLGLKRTTFLDKLRRHSVEHSPASRSALG